MLSAKYDGGTGKRVRFQNPGSKGGPKYPRTQADVMNRRFRNLLFGSTVATLVLMLVGLYTAFVGAGLTCERRWPFCDGWLGLFPANWTSFVE